MSAEAPPLFLEEGPVAPFSWAWAWAWAWEDPAAETAPLADISGTLLTSESLSFPATTNHVGNFPSLQSSLLASKNIMITQPHNEMVGTKNEKAGQIVYHLSWACQRLKAGGQTFHCLSVVSMMETKTGGQQKLPALTLFLPPPVVYHL